MKEELRRSLKEQKNFLSPHIILYIYSIHNYLPYNSFGKLTVAYWANQGVLIHEIHVQNCDINEVQDGG